MSAARHTILIVRTVLLLISTVSVGEQTITSRNIPPEFHASDPAIEGSLEEALAAANNGSFSHATELLQKALAQFTSRHLTADKSIVEDRLASAFLTQGRLEDAKKEWLSALSDATESSQYAVQIDVMVSLSGIAQASGNLSEALDLASRAVDLARKTKSLYLQSRSLGELARLQLLAGKKTEARTAIDEALQIDRLNKCPWEAEHLLYSAWVSIAESDSNLDAALGTAQRARQLAIETDNYIVFIQASTALAHGYIQKGDANAGIRLLEQAQSATSENGTPFFPA